ncbi:MAG: radical SAM protein [Dehalococcoidia bacterium]
MVSDECHLEAIARLWIYTNFDCNLQCSYCCASSSPRAERRALPLVQHKRLILEAAEAGVGEVFLTGGEPFLLPDIAERVRAASERMETTVLTNAMLFQGSRRTALESLAGLPVRFQVSLDGPCAEAHDAIRGRGSWAKAVEGVGQLQALGFDVHISTTETVHNAPYLDETRAFVIALGIPAEAHFVRPLARRGFSQAGVELRAADLVPEVTVSQEGVFWHPLACEDDFLVSRRVFPFADALGLVQAQYRLVLERGELPRPFR